MSKQKSKPILHLDPSSRVCRAALLVAAEINLKMDLRITDIAFPNYMYPVLKCNGDYVSRCKKICAYLADKYSTNDNILPKEQEARNYVMNSLFFGSDQMYFRAAFEPDQENPEVRVPFIEARYKEIELWLTEDRQPFVCGEHLTIADLCCIVGLPRGHEFVPIDEVRFPKLFRWFQRMLALPYYEYCNGKGAWSKKRWMKKSSEKSDGSVVNVLKSSTKYNANGANSFKSARNLKKEN